jgi:hypothetical protein
MGDQAILFEEVQCFKKDGTDVNLPPTAGNRHLPSPLHLSSGKFIFIKTPFYATPGS